MIAKQLLESVPFFWDFTDEEKERLLSLDSYFESFRSGEHLIEEGAQDNALYIILKGSAHVTKTTSPGHVIATLDAGTVVGEISFLTNRPRTTNVVASEKMICFTINGQSMRELDSGMQHKIKDQLIEILVQRLDNMNKTLLELAR
ncbi:MAG: cyclic nucleotide-binding domain-containing protein [Magnetococcales bacterium]|nr:cyclic nucleotide-binding domain-containing protein [Magnetococcales bacterium]